MKLSVCDLRKIETWIDGDPLKNMERTWRIFAEKHGTTPDLIMGKYNAWKDREEKQFKRQCSMPLSRYAARKAYGTKKAREMGFIC
jgi:hypothetical protein